MRRRRESWSAGRVVPEERIESVCCGMRANEKADFETGATRADLEELEVWLAEAVEHELDLEEKSIAAELGSPSARRDRDQPRSQRSKRQPAYRLKMEWAVCRTALLTTKLSVVSCDVNCCA